MKQESINKLKERLIVLYRKYGDKIVRMDKNGNKSTGEEIAIAIENETEEGLDAIEKMLHLTIDLLSRNKI